MNNKGSCLTFNSLINLFPKVNDVLHCDFSIRHLHILEFFFFCFSWETTQFSFSLNKLSTQRGLVLASVWSGLAGGARVWEIGAVSQIFLRCSVLEERHCRSMKKEEENTFSLFSFSFGENVVLFCCETEIRMLSLVTGVMEDHQGTITCSPIVMGHVCLRYSLYVTGFTGLCTPSRYIVY